MKVTSNDQRYAIETTARTWAFGFLFLGRSGLAFDAHFRSRVVEIGLGRVAGEVENGVGGHILHRHRGKVRGRRAGKGGTEL